MDIDKADSIDSDLPRYLSDGQHLCWQLTTSFEASDTCLGALPNV